MDQVKVFGRQPLKNLKWHGSSQIFVPQTWSILEYLEPFYTTDLLLYPLKTTKNHRNQFHEMSQSQTLKPSKPFRNHKKTIPGNQSYYSFTNNTTLFPRHLFFPLNLSFIPLKFSPYLKDLKKIIQRINEFYQISNLYLQVFSTLGLKSYEGGWYHQ